MFELSWRRTDHSPVLCLSVCLFVCSVYEAEAAESRWPTAPQSHPDIQKATLSGEIKHRSVFRWWLGKKHAYTHTSIGHENVSVKLYSVVFIIYTYIYLHSHLVLTLFSSGCESNFRICEAFSSYNWMSTCFKWRIHLQITWNETIELKAENRQFQQVELQTFIVHCFMLLSKFPSSISEKQQNSHHWLTKLLLLQCIGKQILVSKPGTRSQIHL